MPPAPHDAQRRRGFTLIELLVVIGIIAILAGILLPTLAAVRRSAKIASTESLLKRIEVALAAYQNDANCYPPDAIPAGRTLIDPSTGNTWTNAPAALPPEAFCYYLTNPYLTDAPAYLKTAEGSETEDNDRNGHAELIDGWGRPFLYNTFFTGIANFNWPEPPSGLHNPDSFDLYSVGPDGQTGANDLPALDRTTATLAAFCANATNADEDGEGDDDIRNWTRD